MTILPIAPRIAVLGSGSWGTAIASSLARNGRPITLWSHSHEAARTIANARENRKYLPGIRLPDSIAVTGDDAAIAYADILVSVIPSEFLRPVIGRLRSHMHARHILLSATKGLAASTDNASFLRISQVITASLAEVELTLPVGSLSGPSFAQEVAAGQPTAITVAFEDHAIASLVQREFASESLRLYTSADLIGVELGGALKNVIAIAAGITAGMGLGSNSTAGLITRGIAEMTRLAVSCGGRRETLAGLAGLGDLVLTCTGTLSRNRTVGVELGKGRKLPEILASLGGKVAEGVHTTRAALGLARQQRIEMPITEQMELILDHGKNPREAIKDLMLRPGKHEH
ncbi:NAD(P)H-dependent glycerol-3-phosphate dehydrogenase [Terracidiphilus sp.]|uniref:NAD(P)H-dependent glycerol-3-phosphate dehydrogenase n=1 Tax=Terracidiphilus sp. TaxID=1964191 RepID=UPI003C215690